MSEKFFAVHYSTPLYFEVMDSNFSLPNLSDFEGEIPSLFNLSGTTDKLDYNSAKELKKYGPEFGKLVDQVNSYAIKLNSILYYLFQSSVHDNNGQTITISGSEISFNLIGQFSLKINDILRIQLFIPEYAVSIYCYVKIIKIETNKISTEIILIRNNDQERLIGITTKIQQKELRQRSQEKCEKK